MRRCVRSGLLALLLAVAGCVETAGAPSGGSLTLGLDNSPTSLDPRFATDVYSQRILQLIYGSLVRLDREGRVVPDLAERWETPDARTYVFHLRRGVRFHHGPEVTAADVKFTFDSILDPASRSSLLGSLEVVEAVTAPDPYRVVFRLRRPFAFFLATAILGIIPRDLASAPGADLARHPVGSGPFRFLAWVPNERIDLAAFDAYVGGRPHLDRMVLRIIPDATVRLLELQKGTVDLLIGGIPPETLERLARLPHVRVLQSESNSTSYLGFNLRDPILRHLPVRQGIAHAIDRQAILDSLLAGKGTLATGLLPPFLPDHEPDVRRYAFDPARARRLLDEAGFPVPAGQPYRFTLTYKTANLELSKAIGEAIQEQLAAVGIEIRIRVFEWGTFYGDIKSGNFQLYSLGWIGIADPDIYRHALHSGNVPPRGANRNHYMNPSLDRLLDEGRETLDPRARRAIYSRVQRIVAEDLPSVSLWHAKILAAMRDTIQGFALYPAGDYTPLKDVWLSPGPQQAGTGGQQGT